MKGKTWYVTADGMQHEIVCKKGNLFVDDERRGIKINGRFCSS